MAMKFTPDHNEKKKFDRRCRYLLDQTERAKSASQWPLSLVEADSLPVGPNTASMKLEAPVPQRSLSTREKIILLEGSKLNGLVFPPWETSPDPTEFDLKPGEALFEYVLTSSNAYDGLSFWHGFLNLIGLEILLNIDFQLYNWMNLQAGGDQERHSS